jgi:hypothetical protein
MADGTAVEVPDPRRSRRKDTADLVRRAMALGSRRMR